jgi:hypothetical protein
LEASGRCLRKKQQKTVFRVGLKSTVQLTVLGSHTILVENLPFTFCHIAFNTFLKRNYSNPYIYLRKVVNHRWAGHVTRTGETINAYRLMMGKSERKRPLGRPTRKGVNNIKMDLAEIGWGGMYWIEMAQDRDRCRALVNTVMNPRIP